MVLDCENPTKQEETLCNCKKSVEIYKKLSDAYELARIKHASDHASFSNWKNLHNQWKNKTGEYEKWNDIFTSKEAKFIKHLRWPRICGQQDHMINDVNANWECMDEANKKGYYKPWSNGFYAYDTIYNYVFGDVTCHYNVRCGRTQSSKDGIQNDYQGEEPKTDPKTGMEWLGKNEPKFDEQVPNYQGVCCSQLLNDITNSGGDLSINNISQKCGIGEGVSKDKDTPAEKVNTEEKKDEGGVLYIIIFVVICLLIISSSFGAVLLVSSSRG